MWNRVKDGLVLPLLLDGAALGLCAAPPCLLALPTELLDQLLGCLQVSSRASVSHSCAHASSIHAVWYGECPSMEYVEYRKSRSESGMSVKPHNNVVIVLNPAQGIIYESTLHWFRYFRWLRMSAWVWALRCAAVTGAGA